MLDAEMKKSGIAGCLMISLLMQTGCMRYAIWRQEITNSREQREYCRSFEKRLVLGTAMATWCKDEPTGKTFGTPTRIWLTLYSDGAFGRLQHDLSGLNVNKWSSRDGTWENLGSHRILLHFTFPTNQTEEVDLSAMTTDFSRIEQKLNEGIQQEARPYCSPAAGSPAGQP